MYNLAINIYSNIFLTQKFTFIKTYFYTLFFSLLIVMAARLLGYNNNSHTSVLFAKTLLPPNCDTTPFNCNADLRNNFFTDAQTQSGSSIFPT
ncbi:MAG: hypothetical protein ABJA79_05140, partial [Parafilimonas sp.]